MTDQLMPNICTLHKAWLAADTAWHNAIVDAYPKKWPGDVRYTPAGKGEPGTPLRAAHDAWESARDAFHAAGGFNALRPGRLVP